MNNWLICSYYTKNYKDVAEKYLIPSLKQLNLDCHIIELSNFNSWKEATDYKPIFIKECLNRFKVNIVWIDCDATVNKYPILFDIITQEYDIGVHYFNPKLFYSESNKPSHVASGTIFIKNSEYIHKLIEEWINLTPSTRWEQMALQLALENNSDIKVYQLPREYCYITTQPNNQPPKVVIDNPIISHFQASRERKNKHV